MPGWGQLLSCVARDPVLSQPSALPHWLLIPRHSLGLQELLLHSTEEPFLLHIFLFERGNSSFLEVSSRLSLVAHWSGQEYMLPGHSSLQRKQG